MAEYNDLRRLFQSNDSLLSFFWGIQLLMGFCVVCRVFEEESNSCHYHGKGGEAGEPHRVTQLQHGANSWPVWLLQQYSWEASCRRGCYCHSQSSDRRIVLPLNCPWLQSFIWPWRAVVTSSFMCKGNKKLAGFQQTLVLSGACVVYIKLQNTFRTNSPQQAKLF